MNALNMTTLVLNADFRPMALYPLSRWAPEKTFKKVQSGAAIVVAEYDRPLRSARASWNLPSVVALSRYVGTRQRVTFNRGNLLVRDNFECQYCKCRLTKSDLTFDHVIPSSKGGPTNFMNIVAACMDCNARKRDRTDIRPIRDPREPSMLEMARNAPLRRSDHPDSWLPFLEPYGLFAKGEDDRDDLQKAIDEAYWEGELETS